MVVKLPIKNEYIIINMDESNAPVNPNPNANVAAPPVNDGQTLGLSELHKLIRNVRCLEIIGV